MHLVYLGLVVALLQNGCIHATINRVIPNLNYEAGSCDGEKLLIECPVGFSIQITDGRYGRRSPTQCIPEGENPVPEEELPCEGISVFEMPAVSACNSQETCKVLVTHENLQLGGDPCPEKSYSKYLFVSFTCIKAINENLVCEGDTATLSCPGQEVIQVVDVLYGRNNKETCADNGNTANTECYSPDAGWKVTELCNHKPYCEIQASSSMFGEPCEGTSKYLRIIYQCASCTNEHGDDATCDDYALRGECEVNPPWMMSSCRKSCWRCDTNSACQDQSDFYDCTKWASTGECQNNEQWMKEHCQYSCNRCWETVGQGQEVNDGRQPEDDQKQVAKEEKEQQEFHDQPDKQPEEKVEVHKRDTRNYSDKTDSGETPLKRYYSLIALGATVLVMTSMVIWLSLRPKENKNFKKSA